MTLPATTRVWPRIATGLLLPLLLLAGCGEQDLYDPPGAPYQVIGRAPLPSLCEDVAVLGSYAFVAGGQAGLHVIDISAPGDPELVQTLNTTKYAESIEVVRTFANHELIDLALVVEGTEGITSYDITNPTQVESFNQGTTAVDGKRIFVLEPVNPDEPFFVFLAESWHGIRVFESDPEFPGLLEYNGVFAGTQGYAEGIAVKDGYAFVADDEMGLAVMDARELVLGSVELVAWADSPGNAVDVALAGNHAYVADGTEGLIVYLTDGPSEPELIAQLDLSGFCRSIAIRDNLVCIAAATAGTHFIDVSNPAAPVFLGTIVSSYASDLEILDDGKILVADREDGVLIMGGHDAFRDPRPPAPVTSLTATAFSTEAVQLNWFATGDDGMLGRATSCDIRYAAEPITEASWANATPVSEPPSPVAPGDPQSFIVGGLLADTDYNFALKYVDDAGQSSPLSNSVMAATFSGIVLSDPDLDLAFGNASQLFTFEVTYVYSISPDVNNIIIDGTDSQVMDLVSGEPATGALYRFQTTLPAGVHSYSFEFAEPGGQSAQIGPFDGPTVGRLALNIGSLLSEPGRENDETLHGVVLTDSVLASPHEVTQAEWVAAGLVNNSSYPGDNRPVENINWFEAIEYCNLRSAADALSPAYTLNPDSTVSWDRLADGWRLPTEAEWEWLCRAGTETAFSGGEITETQCILDPVLDQLGWYCGNAGNAHHAVESKAPNAYGLYDMHGNVWEWCWDWYASYPTSAQLDPAGPDGGFQKVIRGGTWFHIAADCRSASRGSYWPRAKDNIVGMRTVRTIFTD